MTLEVPVQVALIGFVGSLVVGVVVELLRNSRANKEMRDVVKRVDKQVTNNHQTNLRDDLDSIGEKVAEAVVLLHEHSKQVDRLWNTAEGLREDFQIERRARLRLEGRVDRLSREAHELQD